MYEYRRMTPQQRQSIVEYRRRRGFPLHKPPHLSQGEGWYLITAATYEHRHYFRETNELTALESRLLEALAEASIPQFGWVVLPNHYHVLLHTDDLRTVGRAVGRVHGRSSRYTNQRDDTPGRQVWYKYSDRRMRSERHFWTTVHYIIANPAKHGFCTKMRDWPWSCVHEFLKVHGNAWLDDLRLSYPLRDYGKGWDE